MIECIVIVEDPGQLYRESRIDHAARFSMIQRKKVTVAGRPYLSVTRPPMAAFSMFSDGFTSVVSDLEVIWASNPAGSGSRTAMALTRASTRLDEPEQEEQFHRFDHTLLFRFRQKIGIEMVGFTFELPDLNDDPWLEWVHRPAVTDLFPYRQIRTTVATIPPVMMYELLGPVPQRHDYEIDGRPQVDLARQLYPFRQHAVTPASAIIVRVRATQVGFYFSTRNIGDVFDVDLAHFASDVVDFILGEEGSPFFGWMTVANANEPLSINSPTPLDTANKPRTVL